MSDKDKIFDEYLRRQSPVSQRYRELESDDVPPELDRRVLTQAHEAINKEKINSPVWMRWTRPLALAASVALIVMVTVKIGTQQNTVAMRTEDLAAGTSAGESPAPQTPQASSVEAPTKPAYVTAQTARAANVEKKPAQVKRRASEQKPQAAEAGVRDDLSLEEVVEVAPAAPPTVASPDFAAENSPAMNSATALSTTQSSSVPQAAVARRENDLKKAPVSIRIAEKALSLQAASADKAISAEERESLRVQADPKLWLERIRMLREEGKTQAADEEWKRFVETWPQYPVTETDIARGDLKR